MQFQLLDIEPEIAATRLGSRLTRKVSCLWNEAPLAVWGIGAAIAFYVRPKRMPSVMDISFGDPASVAVRRLVEAVPDDTHCVIECNTHAPIFTFLLVKNAH